MQVIDLISLKPFDMETISNSVRKTRNAIIVEECMKTGGIGASLSAIINETLFDELDHQVWEPCLGCMPAGFETWTGDELALILSWVDVVLPIPAASSVLDASETAGGG